LTSIGEPKAPRGISVDNLCKRANSDLWKANKVLHLFSGYTKAEVTEAFIDSKYEGYLKLQNQMIERSKKLEEKKIPKDFDYHKIKGLRTEAAEKLDKIKPLSVGAASRISGVNPADITILLMHL